MVLVMPDGMPTVAGEGDRNARRQRMHAVFEQDVLDDLIPYVEARYHMWSVWRGYLAAFAPRLWHE